MILNRKWIVPTMDHLPPAIISFLLPFATLFKLKKSFVKFVALFIGALFCKTGTTICGCLRVLGMRGETAFSNYHRILNKNPLNMLAAAKILAGLVLQLAGNKVILVIDEHLERRRGAKIKAKAVYRDPVASSSSWLVKCWGLKWVVISVIVHFPWSKRPFALPIFCALRYPEDHPNNKQRNTRTGIDIACQMLCIIRRWFPLHSLTVLGDGDYARVKLATVCQRLTINLVTRMRADARLYDFPKQRGGEKRQKKLGSRLHQPTRADCQRLTVKWYQGVLKEVTASIRTCLWLGGKKSVVIPITAVWVNMRPNDQLLLMATSPDLDIIKIIEAYVLRWNLEVTFRECRDYLGVETQRQWSNTAIARTTPLLFGLYTVIVLMANILYMQGKVVAGATAWYKKTHLTFSDLLEAVRKEIADPVQAANSILRHEFTDSSTINDPLRVVCGF